MIKALEAIIASGRLQQPELVSMTQALATSYYRAKDYPKAIAWTSRYYREGGADPQMRLMLIHSYFQNGEFDNAAQDLLADVEADEKAGKAPAEDRLQLLANSYLKLNDQNRYAWALEKLVTYYPKKEYWADLIARTQKKPTFADRLALDILRLRLPTGNVEGAEDYMELAESSLRAGFPAEAKKALDKGYAAGTLGTGPSADRHQRMREMVERQLAEDRRSLQGNEMEVAAEAQKDGGLSLVNLGFAYVTNGQYDRGLALMERGMAKGAAGVPNKKSQDSRLHLGIAYLMAGKKDKALEIFKSIDGIHGAADLGRLWAIHARHS
jgi:tetratricopeptide (TPR) repeat protein